MHGRNRVIARRSYHEPQKEAPESLGSGSRASVQLFRFLVHPHGVAEMPNVLPTHQEDHHLGNVGTMITHALDAARHRVETKVRLDLLRIAPDSLSDLLEQAGAVLIDSVIALDHRFGLVDVRLDQAVNRVM